MRNGGGADAERGQAGADQVAAAEVKVVAALPALGGWCALIDADKYLRRGSLWEAHNRLHQARHHVWAL